MSSTARSTTLPYDLLKDFEPVALISTNPQLIVARKNLPANDLKELIAWLKANPDKAHAGTAASAARAHVCGVLFQKATGTRFAVRALSRRRSRDAGPAGWADRSA